MVTLTLVLAAPLSAAAFLDPQTPGNRFQAALAARDLRPQLRALETGRVEARSEPDRKLAVRMVRAMISRPANWKSWTEETERQIQAHPLAFGELRPTLGYHLAVRSPGPETLAYQLGMGTDGASGEMQIGYTQLLMKEPGYRFWPYARAGLPGLNPKMRTRARATIGGAIGSDSEVIAPGHLALARKWLPKVDLPEVVRSYRFWSVR